MSIRLSNEQLASPSPIRVSDPETLRDYVVLRAEEYDQLAALGEFTVREAYPLMDEVARKEGWDDPEMDVYDLYRQPKP